MEPEREEYTPTEYLRRLTSKARRILWKAEVEAAALGHEAVGAEHILLAILGFPRTTAARLLQEAKVDTAGLHDALTRSLGRGADRRAGRRPLSAQARNTLRASALEAERMGVRFIGTDHLLLGVLANAGRTSSEVLRAAGLDFSAVRRHVEAAYRPGRVGGSRRSGRGSGRAESRSALARFGQDFTDAVRHGKLDPVVGRLDEMDRMIEILLRRGKNNPVLVGDAGVGKTAIVEGLAQRIAAGDVPEALRDKHIIALNLGAIIAGTKYRGEFEERVQALIREIRARDDVIAFIDEVHTVVGAGGAAGSLDAANMFKGYLARGELRVIGATTWREYRRYIANDKSLTRRFQPIDVGEPKDEDALSIVEALRPVYESYHGVAITDEALAASVRMSRRYLSHRQLPDKAIDLLDEASAKAKVELLSAPERILGLEERLRKLEYKRGELGVEGDPAEVLELANAEAQVREELRDERQAWRSEIEGIVPEVGVEAIAGILALWSGVPLPILIESEVDRFLDVEVELAKRVVAQDDALNELARSLRRAVAGMRDLRRPIGSFLMLGESGVGKTESAKALAEFVSGDEQKLVRVDMGEFSEWHNVSRLIGSPPGFAGYEESGELTEAVRRNPFSVVLFDDVDKAHPRTLQVLLQIMEDGHITDASGRPVDFRHTVLLMTSNFGVDIIGGPTIGFGAGAESVRRHASFEVRMREYARRHLPAEFLNRVDRVLVFRALAEEDIREITRRTLSDVVRRAQDMNVSLHVTTDALEFLVRAAVDRRQGARPIRRLVGQYVDEPLTERIVRDAAAGRVFELRVVDGDPQVVELDRTLGEGTETAAVR